MGLFLDKRALEDMKKEIDFISFDKKIIVKEVSDLKELYLNLKKLHDVLTHEKYTKNQKEIAHATMYAFDKINKATDKMSDELYTESHQIWIKLDEFFSRTYSMFKKHQDPFIETMRAHYWKVANGFKLKNRLWLSFRSTFKYFEDFKYNPEKALPAVEQGIKTLGALINLEQEEFKSEELLKNDINKLGKSIITHHSRIFEKHFGATLSKDII
jgi:hypothetical protein